MTTIMMDMNEDELLNALKESEQDALSGDLKWQTASELMERYGWGKGKTYKRIHAALRAGTIRKRKVRRESVLTGNEYVVTGFRVIKQESKGETV